jgi:hypothetical protein
VETYRFRRLSKIVRRYQRDPAFFSLNGGGSTWVWRTAPVAADGDQDVLAQ